MSDKGVFYIPTWVLILFFIVSTVSLILELIFFLNIDALEMITVNGMQYKIGTEQYQSGLENLKDSVLILAGTSLIASVITGFFSVKRIRNKQNK